MENPEEILHSLEEFSKMKPKDIPRELEEYLKFVAKTGDPVYQWNAIKSLFREKLINVITEFYESCASMEIPPCPNVEMFNYDLMKNFILEKLETFASAPFTLQRICELLTSPKKEYTRIDKFMRALEKNILVVSTMEPGGRRTENGEMMNGVESDHEQIPEPANEINVEEMDEAPYVQTNHFSRLSFDSVKKGTHETSTFVEKVETTATTSTQEIVCVQYVSIEPVNEDTQHEEVKEDEISVTITAVSVPDKKLESTKEEVQSPEHDTIEESPRPESAREESVQEEKVTDDEPRPSPEQQKMESEENQEVEPVRSSEPSKLESQPEIPTSTTATSTTETLPEPSELSITSSDSLCEAAASEITVEAVKDDLEVSRDDKQEDADSTESTGSEAVAVASEPHKGETNEVEVPVQETKESSSEASSEVSSSPSEDKEKEMEVDVVAQEQPNEPESSNPPESA